MFRIEQYHQTKRCRFNVINNLDNVRNDAIYDPIDGHENAKYDDGRIEHDKELNCLGREIIC
jgi:hypothetical protein